MTTRRDNKAGPVSDPTGFEGNDVPSDFTVPSCTIEDVDRALFNLFDKQLPLQVRQSQNSTKMIGTKKVPVIFATGERFAFLRRKVPLGDRGGDHSALIIPLISITRSSISQDPDNGIGPGQITPIVIKRRLSKESQIYKRLINDNRLKNQDDLADETHNIEGLGSGSIEFTIGTRRTGTPTTDNTRSGKLLTPDLTNNIYETLVIPPIKYFTATYNITLWAQYTQEMNDMIMTIMSLYQNNHRRTFKLESDKGYWFVAYVGSEFSSENNSDDFTDAERIIKCNFDVKVNGYVVAPQYPVYSETNDIPGSGVGRRDAEQLVDSLNYHTDTGGSSIGGNVSRRFHSTARTVVTKRDVFTGAEKSSILTIKSETPSRGETVFRGQIPTKLDDIS
ncbi:MAG: hypothetical protein EBZ49_03220 [Proteobacteria bacterium]|nr:hypothetical protein [Pseudomonadota bacterium]